MTKSATREAADKVTFTQAEVTSAVALKAPIASPSFTGNVGIGVTPEASYPDRPVVRVGSGLGLQCRATGNPSHTWINSNSYQDASTAADKYIGTDQASQIKQTNGAFTFNVAPSGTADAAISWTTPLTITNDGRGLSDFTAFSWCHWNMSNTNIDGSYNVSSIQDLGTGRQRPLFVNNASDSNYSAVANGNSVANWNGSETTVIAVNTTGAEVYHIEANTVKDATNAFVICIGG